MVERSHAELEQYHYHVVHTNPAYCQRLLLDEQAMQMEPGSPAIIREEHEPEPWDYRQWQTVQQLRAEILYVRNQLSETKNTRKGKSSRRRGIAVE